MHPHYHVICEADEVLCLSYEAAMLTLYAIGLPASAMSCKAPLSACWVLDQVRTPRMEIGED